MLAPVGLVAATLWLQKVCATNLFQLRALGFQRRACTPTRGILTSATSRGCPGAAVPHPPPRLRPPKVATSCIAVKYATDQPWANDPDTERGSGRLFPESWGTGGLERGPREREGGREREREGERERERERERARERARVACDPREGQGPQRG